MENKIAKLILILQEFSKKNKKYYVNLDIDYWYKKLTIEIRDIKTHRTIETRTLNMEIISEQNIDNVIKSFENDEV